MFAVASGSIRTGLLCHCELLFPFGSKNISTEQKQKFLLIIKETGVIRYFTAAKLVLIHTSAKQPSAFKGQQSVIKNVR